MQHAYPKTKAGIRAEGRRRRICLLALLVAHVLGSSTCAADSGWAERLAFWSWADMEVLQNGIQQRDQKVASLPELALINSSIRIGLKTGYTTDEDVRWMELTFKEARHADTIVLVPPLAKGANAVVAGFGFPVRFKLEVFDAKDQVACVLDRTTSDFPNPGCSPVIARFESMPIKRVRFTATDPWSVDGPEILALAEMIVLAGDQNLALDATVSSSSSRNAPRAWTRLNLTDMITPLGLPVAPAEKGTLGFHSAVSEKAESEKSVTLTLSEVSPLDEIHLVPVRIKDVPLWFDYGFPVTYKVETATKADFSDAILLHEVTDRLQPTPGMNLVCIPAHRTPARFIRLTTRQLWFRKGDYVFALAEIQALSNGRNLAAGGTFEASDVLTGEDGSRWSPRALGDGLVETGRLISLPQWFEQLANRQVLEQERNELHAQRMRRIEQSQRQLVYGSTSGAAGIMLTSMVVLWRQRRNRHRDSLRLREKLARDLHDEIGSNLGSITLICSLANQPNATPESMRADICEIERVAAETADSMRDMVDLIRARRSEVEANWLDVLHRLTERQLRQHTLDCALPAAPLTVEPDIETRRELYLFCKEVLHNIAKHARASEVRFHLTPTPEGLRIEISDNGRGFDTTQAASGHGLGNLRERASVMKANLQVLSKSGGGTSITLDVPCGHRWEKPDT